MSHYDPPETAPTPAPPPPATRGAGGWFVIHALVWSLVVAILQAIVPKLSVMAADFGLPGTGIAGAVLGASAWLRAHPAPALLGLAVVLVADRAALAAALDAAALRRRGTLLTLPPLAAALACLLGVTSLVFTLIQRLSG